MQIGKRCVRCMKELKEEHTFCMDCGYDQRQDNPERALPAGTLLNDKYLIGAVIGEGGFGITYAAWDMLIETRIAIKEYFPSELVTRDTTLSGEKAAHNLTLIQEKTGEGRYREGLERFVKEAGNLAKFQKEPGVVSVKDFFYENNTAYMVMEYIEGVTLNTYLENRNGKLGTQETFQMIEPVMKTMEAIHREGVIHRDISPDNIMVTETGQMKLIDFGAARFVGVDDEKSLTVILKHGYAPEEQYRSNGEQGSWTDVYALSAVIYRMLTGKAPEETLKRMTSGQDDVHAELRKVQGLSGAERKGLERGLAVKAEKRLRSMEELHKEIYSKTKAPSWKWLAGAVVLFAVVLSVCFVGLLDRRDGKLAVLEEVQEQDALERKTPVPEREEEPEKRTEEDRGEEEEEEPEEPENIRALREYYNNNCLGRDGKVYFIDLTGDDEVELIDLEIENNMMDGVSLWGTQNQSLSVYQYADGTVAEIYHAEVDKEMIGEVMAATEINYYLSVEDGRGVILVEHCAGSKEQVSFETIGNGSVELIAMPEDEFREKRRHSILLLDSFTTMTPAWRAKEALMDYQDVLNFREETANVIDIAETSRETVLDYSVVYDENNPCIFAVTGEIQSNQKNAEYDHMTYYESDISVWAAYDGQIKKIEDSSSYDSYWMGSDIYQFGKSQHYFLLTGLGGAHYIAYAQHKFCFDNNDAYKIDSSYEFDRDENGKIQMEWAHDVKELSGYSLRDNFNGGTGNGDEIWTVDSIDIFFYDHQYVEYGTERVENAELERYENYGDILQKIAGEFKLSSYIGAAPAYLYGMMSYYVQETELDHVRKSVNNVYYLNYKVYGRRLGWESHDFFDQYSEECDVWAYAVLEATGNQLEFRRIVFGKREEFANVGMPVYYGPDRELVNVVSQAGSE